VVLTELNSASDHGYIEFFVSDLAKNVTSKPKTREVQNGWSVKRLSVERLLQYWQGAGPIYTLPAGANAEDHSAHLQLLLTKACDAAMPIGQRSKAEGLHTGGTTK